MGLIGLGDREYMDWEHEQRMLGEVPAQFLDGEK